MSVDELISSPWRVGKSVFRTIYACPPGSSYRQGEVLIGIFDTPELAEAAVRAHNRAISSGPQEDSRLAQEIKRRLAERAMPYCWEGEHDLPDEIYEALEPLDGFEKGTRGGPRIYRWVDAEGKPWWISVSLSDFGDISVGWVGPMS